MTLGLSHPEWVAGRRLWLDPVVQDTIDRLHNGDPVKGWEGDPNLAIYRVDTDAGIVWELMRLEDDGEYRLVCRSKPGVHFDGTIIDVLLENDRQRQTKALHDRIVEHNEKVGAEKLNKAREYMREEAAPRLHRAMEKEHML